MGSIIREKLQEQLSEYILDTLKYTETVKEFCVQNPKWTLQRESELSTMKDIKDKNETFTDYIQSWKQELESTLEGLEKLQHFLDAVEKLAVTSLSVFGDESFMPMGVSSMSVYSMIITARIVSPLLIHFKRDAGKFFLPSLSNVDVLIFQLEKYITTTNEICEKMEKRSESVLCNENIHEWIKGKSELKFNLNMSEESMQKLYDHLLQLTKIRMDESFRLTFLFGEKAQDFINIFSERRSRMLQFLSDLEEAAVQLDRMKMGSDISSVAGSSVSIVGGVCSIVGLALAPVTAGASLILTLTGVGLGVTSGVNSLVTGVTEIAVNSYHGKNADKLFISFMEDVQKILDCLEQMARIEGLVEGADGVTTAVKVGKLAACVGSVQKGIDAIVDGASAVKALQSEEVIVKAVNMGLHDANAGRSIPKLAADLPDIGQLAKGTPLAMSKSARAGFIGLNALFIGLDVLFICKDSISLARGSKNEVAQLIRSRSALWRSEVEAWEKIHDHLCEGIKNFQKNLEILEQPYNLNITLNSQTGWLKCLSPVRWLIVFILFWVLWSIL